MPRRKTITRIVNAYTIVLSDIRPGDVMMFVVKAIVVAPGHYRIYRWVYEGPDVSQGNRVALRALEDAVAKAIFPSLAQVAEPDPF